MCGGRHSLVLLLIAPLVFVAGASLQAPTTSAPKVHTCAQVQSIPLDQDSLVHVGVNVGNQLPSEVKIQFADPMEVKQAFTAPGWSADQPGPTTVHYAGGPSQEGTCLEFSVMVHPTSAGSFAVRAFQTVPGGGVIEIPSQGDQFLNPDGSIQGVVNYNVTPPDPTFEQVINVTGGGSDDGPLHNPVFLITVGLVVAGVAVWLILRGSPKPAPPKPAPRRRPARKPSARSRKK